VTTKQRHGQNSQPVNGLRAAQEEIRQRSEELLEPRQQTANEKERYRDLFDFAPDAYIVTDEQGVVREANRATRRLLDVPRTNLIGKSLSAFVPAKERRAFRQEVHSLARTGGTDEQQWITQLQTGTRDAFTAALTVSTATDEEGKPFLRWMVRDIRELKQVEEVLRRARDELEERVRQRTAQLQEANRRNEDLVAQLRQANQAKDEFLGLLSHELRTSMTLIYGGIKAVRRMGGRMKREERDSLLESVEQEADSLCRMIEDLLNLARLELGEQLTTEPVLVQHVIARFARNLGQNAPGRSVTVDVPSNLAPVVAEPTYVEQILRNLVSNAEKYSPRESPIELQASTNGGGEVVISVLDRGPGIPKEEAEAVFERFYRSQQTPKRVRGIGMGLTVCRRLVEAQRGRIWLSPREGGGLEASFTLPLEPAGPIDD
jgi:PAS domain S-box-containing protein